jgi:hypothetical protein
MVVAFVLLVVATAALMDDLPIIGGTKQIRSGDGAIGLSIPGGWAERKDLNPVQTLGVANILEEKYVVVIVDLKSELQPGTSLEQVAQFTRDILLQNATNEQIIRTSPPGTMVAGYPAVETIVSAVVTGIDAQYIHTMLDAGDRYVQIVGWTLRDRFDRNEAELREVITSLTVGASGTASS